MTAIHNHNTLGKRKSAVARLFAKSGTGSITVNKKIAKDYFSNATLEAIFMQPLRVTQQEKAFDIVVNIQGGGISAQAQALRHAIAKLLATQDETLKKTMKQEGWLTCDARTVERKKVGLRKARKKPKYSKR